MRQSVQAEVPTQVQADGIRLRQILLNLLGNAIKFTEQGSVALHASVEESPTSESVLVLTVADTGIGIARADLPRLFTPFVQSETGATRRFDGTGLGLSISQQLAQLMGGELTLDSELGIGTRATLRIPIAASAGVGSP
ncbi:Autoinducer 2 sensor kinase/phosphatase LuxQ [compost metagenome]